jgi:hypothetical protein
VGRVAGLRIVVAGLIGQYPVGGVTWDYIQYLLGLVALDHDVVYLEDSEQWPYNPIEGGSGCDATFNARYLANVMEHFGLGDRWAYRFPGGSLPTGETFPERWFGLPDGRRQDAIADADLLINVSSGVGNPSRYRQVPRIAYVDTDPAFTQIRAVQDERFRAHLDAHDVLFTYGECASDSVPDTGHVWHPMRKPIAVAEWRPATPHHDVFTTVLNWTSYGDLTWNGLSYGQKDSELLRFLDLPGRIAPTEIELALGSGVSRRAPRELLLSHGWRLADPMRVCGDLEGYRGYIESSFGEWTVAKTGYVLGRAGWFSGRTACYLAAGRPVVVQDTGFAPVLPVGEGIVTFSSPDEAAAGVREVVGNWAKHARAARAIAEAYFDAGKVVGRLLDTALDPRPLPDPAPPPELGPDRSDDVSAANLAHVDVGPRLGSR